MKLLEKLSLKEYPVLSNSEMKLVLGGNYTCWCNNINIGSGASHEDCAAKCSDWCDSNPAHC